MERMPSIEQPKREIITDQEQFRQKMRQFWHRDIDPAILKKELEEGKGRRASELLESGAEMTVLLESMRDEKRTEGGAPVVDKNTFLFASQNEIKRKIVAKAAEGHNMFIQETLFSMTADEEKKEHQILQQIIKAAKRKGPYLSAIRRDRFAVDIAEAKVSEIREAFKNRIIVGADIVVLQGQHILEKPRNNEEAIEILMNISGKRVRVIFGVVALVPANFGKEVLFREGVCLNLQLRKFSEAEAKRYLDQFGRGYLNVVGVLDYASPLVRSLILDSPVEAEVLGLRKVGEPQKTISISPNILTQLKDYFMGVPIELIEEMLRRAKSLT